MLLKITDESYFESSAISQSDLKEVLKSPRHFYHKKFVAKDDPTPAMRLGSAVHMAVLEPEEFNKKYILTDLDRRTRAFKEAAGTKIALSRDEAETVLGIKNSLNSSDEVKDLLLNSHIEHALFWKEKGLDCRAKFDAISDKHKLVIDLKTTESAYWGDFKQSIIKYQYDFQCAFYSKALRAIDRNYDFLFIAVEKKPPYEFSLIKISNEDLSTASIIVDGCLMTVKTCMENNRWPGYPRVISTISLTGDL